MKTSMFPSLNNKYSVRSWSKHLRKGTNEYIINRNTNFDFGFGVITPKTQQKAKNLNLRIFRIFLFWFRPFPSSWPVIWQKLKIILWKIEKLTKDSTQKKMKEWSTLISRSTPLRQKVKLENVLCVSKILTSITLHKL